MRTTWQPLTFLLALTFLFLFSGSVYGDDLNDGLDAYDRGDFNTAYKLFLPLAEQGNADAQFNLGFMYQKGHGVPQDHKEAVKWYRLAVEQGFPTAQLYLGGMYLEGLGVRQDYKEAEKWFRLAAEQGDASAQFNLGVMYDEGQGVDQDYVLAHMWYNLAGSSGNKDSTKNKKLLEEKMTPQQIEKAKEMARNWKLKK